MAAGVHPELPAAGIADGSRIAYMAPPASG